MLYSEEKKDWIMVDWQGKVKFIWKWFFFSFFFNGILILISNVSLFRK